MKHLPIFALACLAAAVTLLGCARPPAPSDAKSKGTSKAPHSAAHVHGKGPNGGVVFDLGKYHAEFTVDHDKKECTLRLLGDDEKTPVAANVSTLSLTTKATKTDAGTPVAPMTIKLLAEDAVEGKAKVFVGSDPGLGNVADFAGTVVGEIDGRPVQGNFEEKDDADPKHEHKK